MLVSDSEARELSDSTLSFSDPLPEHTLFGSSNEDTKLTNQKLKNNKSKTKQSKAIDTTFMMSANSISFSGSDTNGSDTINKAIPDKTENSFSDVEMGDGASSEAAPPRTKRFIVLVACVAALGGLIFGFDIAGAGATFVMDGFKQHFGWECAEGDLNCAPASQDAIDKDKGLINGLFGVGAAIGALMNNYFIEKLGRRKTLGLSSLVFMFGAGFQTYAPVMAVMQAARIFSGMGVGMLSLCSPVYIGECAPEHVRGALGTLWQLAITVGIVLASACNLGLQHWDEGWRLSYGGNIVFAILLLCCLAFMPESPRWLAAHGTEDDVKEALKQLRYEDEIEGETKKLYNEVETGKELGEASWKEVFGKKNKMSYRVWLGMILFAFQQLCGINAVMFYAPDILNTFFTESEAVAGTLALNVINCVSTFITAATVDKFGRTKLLTIGGIQMFVTLLVIGVLSSIEQTMAVGWGVLVAASIYIIGFA